MRKSMIKRLGFLAVVMYLSVVAGNASAATIIHSVADTFVMTPGTGVTSAFANPDYNYGGAGSLSVASLTASQQKGEFIALLKFDFSSFAGQDVSELLLSVNLSDGNKSAGGIFNYPGSNGSFDISWFDTDWVEGGGHPLGTVTTGITYNSLKDILATDPAEFLNAESFDRTVLGGVTYSLSVTDALASAISAGETVSLMLSPSAGSNVAFNLTGNNNAFVTVTTVPEPSTMALLLAGSVFMRRKR